jgi:hypothetical protein
VHRNYSSIANYRTKIPDIFLGIGYFGIFGPKRDEVTGEWRRLHNEELNDLYSSPNVVRVIKPRRMRWAGHVAHMGEGKRCRQEFGRE